MERDDETGRREAASRTGQRGWTRRVSGHVQYRRYTAKGYNGGPFIFFEFSLEPGQTRISDAIYAVMNEHKRHPDGYPTGLTSRKNGALWGVPEHEHTRALAVRIDMALQAMAKQLDKDQQFATKMTDGRHR